MRRAFLPNERKYSPDQARDDHGRFSAGGGSFGGAVTTARNSGASTAAKILGGVILVAGGISHLQAYARRIQRISQARTAHEAIALALTPVRRKSADAGGDIVSELDLVTSLGEDEVGRLLDQLIRIMPPADAEYFYAGLRQRGIL